MNVSRASFGEVQRSLAELKVMHRWRTEWFRHLVHSLEVDLCVAEQRQIDLSAHRGHVGLRPLRIEPSALSDETPKAMRPPGVAKHWGSSGARSRDGALDCGIGEDLIL